MKLMTILIIYFITTVNIYANEIEKVSLQLQWKYQFQFAGFIIAKENGYYKDVGLDVDILEYNNTNSIKDLEEKKVDFVINNSLLAYNNQKLNEVSLIATYFQRSPLVIITQPEVKSVLNLKNKTVMISENNRLNSSLSMLFEYFDINPNNTTFLKPTFDLNDFIDKKVDAMTAYRSNELFMLNQKKIPYTIIDPVEYGFTTNAINLFTSHDKINNNAKQVNDFLTASKKGWEYALNNIEEVAKLIHEKYQPNKSIESLIYEGKITKELMLLNLYDIGEINRQFVHKTYRQLLRNGKLSKEQKNDRLIYQYSKDTKKNVIDLTNEEKEYLSKTDEITMCIDPDWMPFEKFNQDGNHIGITSDYYNIFRKTLQTDIKLIKTNTWNESLENAKKRKCDILSLAMETPERKKYLNFTIPYLKVPLVIATKLEIPFISNIEAIKNKSVGITKGYAFIELLRNKYQNLNIVEVKNIEEGLIKVNQGELFGYIGTLATISHQFQSGLRGELKIAGKLNENWELGIGVRDDDPLLFSILEKAVKSVDTQKQQQILNNWISIKYEKGIDYSLVIVISIFFTVIIALIIFWNIKLKKEIIKRKEAEESFKSISTKLNGLYNLSPLGIALTDMNGNYIEFNDAFERICGYGHEELKTLDYWKLTPLKYENDEKEQLELLENTGFYGPYEKEYIQKDGSLIPINLNGMIITSDDGTQYVWSIIEDISSRKKSEKTMLEQSKLAAMGEMIGNIAHQWRQPLSVISTCASGMKMKKSFGLLEDDEFNKTCDDIDNNVQYLSNTIDDFRNFIKGDRTKKFFNLEETISSFLNLVHSSVVSSKISIVLDVEKNISLNGYENELIQCIINIFNNSQDALLHNKIDEKLIFISLSKDVESVIIKIKDNAGGIEPDVLDKVFEPYFTTKHQSQGTGLGLHMTYNLIVDGMKGSIEAKNRSYAYENKSYNGAEFIISLPLR